MQRGVFSHININTLAQCVPVTVCVNQPCVSFARLGNRTHTLLSVHPSGLPLAVSEVDRSLQLHLECLIIHKGHFVTKTRCDGAIEGTEGQNNFGSKIGVLII